MSGMTKTQDALTPFIQAMIKKAQGAQGGFARIYPLYQQFQTERFESENASEGDSWPDLTEDYAKYKLKRYGGGPRRASKKHPEAGSWKTYPGAGTKMLIGTGFLAGAVIGPGAPFDGTSQHRVLFTDTEMSVSVEESGQNSDDSVFDYAHFVAETRPFMEFSDEHIAEMRDELRKFLLGS